MPSAQSSSQNENFVRNALFKMKTRVSLKYFANYCSFLVVEILSKRTFFTEFWAIFPKLFENCAFPQNFRTKKLSEITVF